MFNEKDRVFSWLSIGYNGEHQVHGPYYTNWIEAIGGERYYHTLEEMLKLPLSDSMKKRLSSAKEGTKIKMHHYSRGTDRYVVRLTKNEIKEVLEKNNLSNRLDEVNKEIMQATSDLQKEKAKLQKQLAAIHFHPDVEKFKIKG